MSDNDVEEADDAIGEILGPDPRAAELAGMIAALESRRTTLQRELDGARSDAERKEWTTKLREVDRQIGLLREEMAITDFVEKSVRAAIQRPQSLSDLDYADE